MSDTVAATAKPRPTPKDLLVVVCVAHAEDVADLCRVYHALVGAIDFARAVGLPDADLVAARQRTARVLVSVWDALPLVGAMMHHPLPSTLWEVRASESRVTVAFCRPEAENTTPDPDELPAVCFAARYLARLAGLSGGYFPWIVWPGEGEL